MIDCHIHSARSHHGDGDLEDFVISALDKKLHTIAFTEHAPFVYDNEQRLSEGEVEEYLNDINRLKRKYWDKITILSGLEVDFTPSGIRYITEFVRNCRCDLILGSVHFIETDEGRIKVWDYKELQDTAIQQAYFSSLYNAVRTKLFDAIAHPDLILRSGLEPKKLMPQFKHFVDLLTRFNVAYELNCSGLSKPSYDPQNDCMITDKMTYPSQDGIKYAMTKGIKFTIGSDAHEPNMVGKNIPEFIEKNPSLKKQILYFE